MRYPGATPTSARPAPERNTDAGRIQRRASWSEKYPKSGWISDEARLPTSTIVAACA